VLCVGGLGIYVAGLIGGISRICCGGVAVMTMMTAITSSRVVDYVQKHPGCNRETQTASSSGSRFLKAVSFI